GGASDERALSVRAPVPLPATDEPLSSRMFDGVLLVTVPARAVPEGRVLHVRTVADGFPSSQRVVAGAVVEFGPDGLRFERDVEISLAVPASVPAAERPHLRIYRAEKDRWTRVRDTEVSDDRTHVTAEITRTGIYALFTRAEPAAMEKADGDGQQAALGAAVPLAPSVVARDAEATPVEGAVVRFEVAGGGGAIVGA